MSELFSKLGYKKRQAEWFPILLVRVCLGVFFILSGFFKVFDAKQHSSVLHIFKQANFPMPELFAYLIPILELICGVLILVGLLCTLASFILFLIMIAAIITEKFASAMHHGGLMIIENFLYLPEVLYALMLIWLMFSGPGKVSFDFSYGKKKRMSTY